MESTTGQDNSVAQGQAHRNHFFAPDRPVDGTTVFVRPPSDSGAETPSEGASD
jgi:hypothetical protein